MPESTPVQRYDLRPLVIAAVASYDCADEGIFDLATFGIAMRDHFGLSRAPSWRQCEATLATLPYVSRHSGRWKYDEPVRPATRASRPQFKGMRQL